MKITRQKLNQIIKEESREVLNEGYGDYSAMVDDLKRNLKENDIDLFSEPEDQPGASRTPPHPVGGAIDYIHAARDVVKDAVQAGATREEMGALLKAVEAAIEYSFAGRGSMKITESRLKLVIKEEYRKVFAEEGGSSDPVAEDIKDAIEMLTHMDDEQGGLFHVINRLETALEESEPNDIKDAIEMLTHMDDEQGGLFHVINRLETALEKVESQTSSYKENY